MHALPQVMAVCRQHLNTATERPSSSKPTSYPPSPPDERPLPQPPAELVLPWPGLPPHVLPKNTAGPRTNQE
jgi:hypothetical protein